MGTLELQNKVKIYLKELDWSYYHLAEAVYEYENDDFGHREEIETLKEKIKKQLSRATTKCSVLTHYINVIEESEKFINLKKKKLVHYSHDVNGVEMEQFLISVSRSIEENDL
ncbi:TPA: hypothetical protein N2774_004632 [Vibrio parahaemolyticus]|nr:hypothetical protein [Vibrio parahaemolyticus]